jgi:hypothetical protein
MSGPQFFHLQTFSRKANPGGQSVDQVLGEALRDPAYCRHVSDPQPPTLLYGVDLDELSWDHETMTRRASTEVHLKDGTTATRAVRKDRHTLGTFVASYPVPLAKIEADATGRERALYKDWKQLNLDLLQRRFGPQLKCVVEHTDEAFGHLHAFMLPDHRPDVDARCFNPAFEAKRRVEADGKRAGLAPIDALKAGNEAYKAAARAMADEYFREVGAPAGLTRDGPRRRRLSRGEWTRERLDARAGARLIRQEHEAATKRAQEDHRAALRELEEVRALTARLEPLRGAVAALDAWEADKARVEADKALAAWWAMTPQERVTDVAEWRRDAYRQRAAPEELERMDAELDQLRAEAGTIIRVTEIDHDTGRIAGQDLRTGEEVRARVVLTEKERVEHYPDRQATTPEGRLQAARRVLHGIREAWSKLVVGSVVYLGALRLLPGSGERIAAVAKPCDPPRLDPRTAPMPEAAKPATAFPEPLRQAVRSTGLPGRSGSPSSSGP